MELPGVFAMVGMAVTGTTPERNGAVWPMSALMVYALLSVSVLDRAFKGEL